MRLPGEGIKDCGPARLLVEESGGGVELGFEIGIGAAAGGVRGALVEEGPESPTGVRND